MITKTISLKRKSFSVVTNFLVISMCVFMGLLLLFAPGEALRGARAGLNLCAEVVVPSLFPFLVLTTFVVYCGLAEKLGHIFEPIMKWIFKLPGSAATAFGLGIIGGYPAGALAVAGLCKRGVLNKKDSERLLCFCINSGPAFVIGAVGAGLLKSTQAGVLIYAAHIGASLIIGVFSRFFSSKNASIKSNFKANPLSLSKSFVSSVTDSAKSMLSICAFVVFFAAVISLLNYTGIIPYIAHILNSIHPISNNGINFYIRILFGFFEVSNGCAAAVSIKGMQAVLVISAILSWSSLSVQFQVMSVIKDAGLSIRYFIMTRFFHIILSVLLTMLLFSLFPVALPVFLSSTIPLTASIHSAPACVALFIISGMLLLSQLKI
jgi:sporulation integral membrane protein YlbJ